MRRRQRRRKGIALHIRIVAQITHRCRPFARQNHERIRQILPACVKVWCVVHAVAQIVHRLLKGEIRHHMPLRPRTRKEIADIGIQPEVSGLRTPQTKAAIASLPRQNKLDGLCDAAVQIAIHAHAQRACHIFKIKKRQSLGSHLLCAAVRIAIQRLQQTGRIKACQSA